MNRILRWLGRAALVLAVLAGLVWVFAPREPVEAVPFEAELTTETVAAHFATAEARFDDVVPGTEKRVIWHGSPDSRTEWAVVYIHGFSSTSEEIRPVPDRVARALRANLVFTRLTGHGRDGDDMATATAGDWLRDTSEALAAARAVGDRVLVIATSTGGTLAALAALDPEMSRYVEGMVLVSPNFGVNHAAAGLLTWPGARVWVPLIVGETRSFPVRNDDHARYWTESYPTVAALPMAALVKHALAQDWAEARVPLLILLSDEDRVVDPVATRAVAAEWGGPVELRPQELGEGDDIYSHVLAGHVLSPSMSEPVALTILDWVRDLAP